MQLDLIVISFGSYFIASSLVITAEHSALAAGAVAASFAAGAEADESVVDVAAGVDDSTGADAGAASTGAADASDAGAGAAEAGAGAAACCSPPPQADHDNAAAIKPK